MNIKDKLLLFIKGSNNSDTTNTTIPKQKKVREKKITRLQLILAGIIFLAALITFIVIRVKIANKDVVYHEYEEELVNSANIYYELKDIEIIDGSTERVDAKTLIKENLVNIDSELVDKCKGYVETVSEKDYSTGEYVVTRKAYIKCGNKYKTVNYISE